MTDLQKPTLPPRRTTPRRCLVCQSPMEFQRFTAARAGFEHWTLRCTRCGRIDQVQMDTDPVEIRGAGLDRRRAKATSLDARRDLVRLTEPLGPQPPSSPQVLVGSHAAASTAVMAR